MIGGSPREVAEATGQRAEAWQLGSDELLARLAQIDLEIDRLALERAQLLAEAESRGATSGLGLSTAEWWHRSNRISARQARAEVAKAVQLTGHEATMAAVAQGSVSMAQAEVVVGALRELPDDFTADQVLDAELMLLDHCSEFDPMWLRRLGRRAVAIIAPEVADARDERALQAAERKARRDRWFSWRNDGMGSVLFKGQLPAVEAELVIETLTAIVTPAPMIEPKLAERVRRGAGPVAGQASEAMGEAEVPALGELPVDPVTGWVRYDGSREQLMGRFKPVVLSGRELQEMTRGELLERHPELRQWLPRAVERPDDPPGGAEVDVRSSSQRHADALVELCRAWRPGSGGEAARPRVVVTVGLDALQRGDGAEGSARLVTTGEAVSVAEVRRLACEAGVLPAVLGGEGQVLDLGREKRLAVGACRQALVVRDRGCAFPGCEKPPRECEAHHIVPWWQGGATDVDNLVLLCAHHHRLVEPNRVSADERTWSVAISPTDGLPWFTPPAGVDVARRPVRHQRFHPRLAG